MVRAVVSGCPQPPRRPRDDGECAGAVRLLLPGQGGSGDKLQGRNPLVIGASAHQIVMRSHGLNHAVLDQGNPVGLAHRGDAVGDHENGLLPGPRVHIGADEFFVVGIERRGHLVEEENRGILDDRPRDVEPLRLAA